MHRGSGYSMHSRKEQGTASPGRDRATQAHALELHRVQGVPTSRVEVDARLWDAVRLSVPAASRKPATIEARVYPVVEQSGRLVLLAGFEEFLAVVAAGATSVSVWPAEIEAGERLEEYAIAFSIR